MLSYLSKPFSCFFAASLLSSLLTKCYFSLDPSTIAATTIFFSITKNNNISSADTICGILAYMLINLVLNKDIGLEVTVKNGYINLKEAQGP